MKTVRAAQAADAALGLAADCLRRQPPSPLLPQPAGLDAEAAARLALERCLDGDEMAPGWVALDDDGRCRAFLSATLEITDEDHPAFTYMPPRYAMSPLSAWHVASAADLPLLSGLLGRLADDAAPHGVERLTVQTRPHDWVGGAFWRSAGLRPDSVLAARSTLPLPDLGSSTVAVRPAVAADEDAIVALSFEEHEYHAAHTRSGTRSGQPDGPTRRIVRELLATTDQPGAYVATDAAGTVLGCLSLYVHELPPRAPGRAYIPVRYGYIGLTAVTEPARGRGVGRALTRHALSELDGLGLDHTLLHYIDDNALSRPFWNAMGFSPLVVALSGSVLGRETPLAG